MDATTQHTDGTAAPAFPSADEEPEVTRRLAALLLGDREGWFRYTGVVNAGALATELQYRVIVRDRPRVLLADEVLPYVLGVADSVKADVPALYGYRDGLA